MTDSTETSYPKVRIVENFVVVWLDPAVKEFQDDYENSIQKLRRVVNSIKPINDPDECLEFLRKIKDERIFVIASGGLGQKIIKELQQMRTIITVYIFCFDKERHMKWAKNYSKIKDVFTEINPLCAMLKEDVRQSNSDLISFNVISTPKDETEHILNDLDSSFMYSQLMKEFIFEMTYDNNAKDEFVKFCRIQYGKNISELDVIGEFEKYYPKKTNTNKSSPIWWYTREGFLYQMLNRALRTQDIELIMKMAFIIRDLHEQIKILHSDFEKQETFTVYRGQGMLPEDIQRLEKNKGGLLSFNSFLSTSENPEISRSFVERALENPNHIAVHFLMNINRKKNEEHLCIIGQREFFRWI